MALSQQVKLVSNKLFNDIGSGVAVSANTLGPTNGHFLLTPNGDGVGAGINLRTVVLGLGATSLTSCTMKVCLDPAGQAVLGYAVGTVVFNGSTSYTVVFDIDTLVVNAGVDSALLTLLSTASGRIYLLFKPDVNVSIETTVVEWEACQV